jgi:hypothetical protein
MRAGESECVHQGWGRMRLAGSQQKLYRSADVTSGVLDWENSAVCM